MSGSLANGWSLARQSFRVLLHDKSLLVFPLLSFIACSSILLSFVAPALASDRFDRCLAADGSGPFHTFFSWAMLFALYFLISFAVTFFNSALVACAIDRFRGGSPTVIGGLRVAVSRLPQILAWALVAASVGMILNAVESRSRAAGRFATALLGAAWSAATFFVVPVLVVEQVGPVDAVRRSTAIIKDTWGAALVGNASIGIFVFLAILASFVPAGLGLFAADRAESALPAFAGIGVTVVLMFLIGLVSAALRAIQVSALYELAARGQAPPQFDEAVLRRSFRAR